MSNEHTAPKHALLRNFYISRINWLAGPAREDLVDEIADDYFRPADPHSKVTAADARLRGCP